MADHLYWVRAARVLPFYLEKFACSFVFYSVQSQFCQHLGQLGVGLLAFHTGRHKISEDFGQWAMMGSIIHFYELRRA